MTDAILFSKSYKFLTCEDRAIICDKHFWQTMSGEDRKQMFYCHGRCGGSAVTSFTSIHLEWASIKMRKCRPRNGPAYTVILMVSLAIPMVEAEQQVIDFADTDIVCIS